MFGGKKLKDLTEEDIRAYAASLVSQSGGGSKPPEEEEPERPEPARKSVTFDEAEPAEQASAPSSTRQIAQAIAERSVPGPGAEEEEEGGPRGLTLARAESQEEREERERRERQRAAEERRQREEAEREAVQARLSEEEQLRLEVLAELERSQMPAVQQEDGLLLKTIEHYTFADTMEVATISIDLDKDLFEGAAAHVTEANVEVTTRDSEVTILLHGVPASKTVAALADWRLHLAPLFHTVDEEGTSWKVRKGKVSVRLRKRKQQEWRRVLKF